MDNADEDTLDALREKRVERMRKQREQMRKWKMMGHGEYYDLSAETNCQQVQYSTVQ